VRGRPRVYRRDKGQTTDLQRLQQNGSCPERIETHTARLGAPKPHTVQFFGQASSCDIPFLLKPYLHYTRVILVRGPNSLTRKP